MGRGDVTEREFALTQTELESVRSELNTSRGQLAEAQNALSSLHGPYIFNSLLIYSFLLSS